MHLVYPSMVCITNVLDLSWDDCNTQEKLETMSAYHLYGNFGLKFPSNGTGILLGTENRNGIELYHLQNTGKFFAFSRLEAWHW